MRSNSACATSAWQDMAAPQRLAQLNLLRRHRRPFIFLPERQQSRTLQLPAIPIAVQSRRRDVQHRRQRDPYLPVRKEARRENEVRSSPIRQTPKIPTHMATRPRRLAVRRAARIFFIFRRVSGRPCPKRILTIMKRNPCPYYSVFRIHWNLKYIGFSDSVLRCTKCAGLSPLEG